MPKLYKQYHDDERNGIAGGTTKKMLVQMLDHCQTCVPYYAGQIRKMGNSFHGDPEGYLHRFPILTKEIIRNRFDDLKSVDLPQRNWFYNTSGGSTGEPVRLIQDSEYEQRMDAIKMLYSEWMGRQLGEPEIRLWGSERDIFHKNVRWRDNLDAKLKNTMVLNAFRMTPADMRRFIAVLNAKRPRLVVAYAQAIYELARFAQREGLRVVPQSAISTSAGTLYSFMRETIEAVFQCNVFNFYGSREVGVVACQRPGFKELWVAPWGNYVEIVDDEGNLVPNGSEGSILVTSLANYAMPLIRYYIGDRGVLSIEQGTGRGRHVQLLESVLGRTVDTFRTRAGGIVDGEYFTHLLYFRDWILKFQVLQKSASHVIFKIVKSESDYRQSELEEISTKTRLVMGESCAVDFEFVDDIQPASSGKYRYTISEVHEEVLSF